MTKRRSPILAALASFSMPGLGQLYNGQVPLAVVWFVGYWAVAVLYTFKVFALMAAPNPAAQLSNPVGLLLIMGVIWLAGVVQAVFAALDRPDYELQPYNRGLVYFGLYVLAYVVLPLAIMLPLTGRTARLKEAVLGRVGQPVDLKIDIPDPEVAAASAVTVFHITLVGGPDGGIYDAVSHEALCTRRASAAAPSWAALYTNVTDTAGLTAIQFRVPVAEGETNDFQLSVNRGNGADGRIYLVDGRRPWGEDGRGRASVERRGEGAVIRVDATTEQGVRVEAVVQCRKVAVE